MPPVARRRTDHPLFRRDIHDDVLEDRLSWLRDRSSSGVLEHLAAENAHTASAMADTEELQQTLYAEMVGRIEEDDIDVPVRFGKHWYYERRREAKQHAVHCRREAQHGVSPDESYDPSAPEQVLLDLDDLRESEGLSYLSLGAYRPSPCGRLLAYSVDRAGHERFEVRVLDLATGEHLADRLQNASHSLAWGTIEGCSEMLYYVTRDEAQRPHKVLRHRLGTDPADDELLWHEDDDRFFVAIRRSRSGRYLFLSAGSHTTSEVKLLDARDPQGEVRTLTGRHPGVEFDVDHHPGDPTNGISGRFFLLTNLEAREFRLLEVSEHDPARENWQDLVPHDPSVHLDEILVLGRHLVLRRRVEGLPSIRVFELKSGAQRFADVEFADPAHDVQIGPHAEQETARLRLMFQSPIRPRTTLEVELGDAGDAGLVGARSELKVEIVHGYDSALYETRRLVARAPDGEAIPVDFVQRRERRELLGGHVTGPLLLYGYGAYGHSLEAGFRRNVLSLLDRGWAFAVAHVRGGGEMGKWWHEAGRVENKENTFYDFVAAAEYLIESGLTSPRHLAIRGGSAGGLLIGAVLNLRPDLCHAAVADVPFVDVLQTMLDPSLPLTVIEYEEWGNPAEDIAAFRRIRGYSPVEGVGTRDAAYPHLLATAGLHDPRVQYWEPAKWVQVLREKTRGGQVLLQVHLEAGHGGASGRYESLRQEALRQAFLLAAMATERESVGAADMPQSRHG